MKDNKEDEPWATCKTQYKKYMDCIKVLVKYDYQQHVGFNKDYQITMIVINMDH
jgi:hypothetical protein